MENLPATPGVGQLNKNAPCAKGTAQGAEAYLNQD